MNWGKGLTIAIIIIMLSFLGMVYISFRQTNEMIEDNYYDRELKYQDIINSKNRLNPYIEKLFIKDTANLISIELPSEISSSITEGEILFLKMDNQRMDKKIQILQSKTYIPKSDFQKGIYHYKIKWINETDEYFHEDQFTIQ